MLEPQDLRVNAGSSPVLGNQVSDLPATQLSPLHAARRTHRAAIAKGMYQDLNTAPGQKVLYQWWLVFRRLGAALHFYAYVLYFNAHLMNLTVLSLSTDTVNLSASHTPFPSPGEHHHEVSAFLNHSSGLPFIQSTDT